MENASTYRAVQAVSPGKLELTQKPLVDPPAGHVRIRVEACGVCHSDFSGDPCSFPPVLFMTLTFAVSGDRVILSTIAR